MCIFRSKTPPTAVAPDVTPIPTQTDTLAGKTLQTDEGSTVALGTQANAKKTVEEDQLTTNPGQIRQNLQINPTPTGINTGTTA